MSAILEKMPCSYKEGDMPLVLGDIFEQNVSIARWKRSPDEKISLYFDAIFDSIGAGINGVFALDSLKQTLEHRLPEGLGKSEAIDDIYLLSDMLTCLFDCNEVGLRLVPLKSAMCPSFHVDNIQVRLVTTYLGSGTQWLPLESLCSQRPRDSTHLFKKTNFGQYYQTDSIRQLQSFDVALLKGKAWSKHESSAAVHRSCQLAENERRVLLTLDPL